jgi:hypothetical protein
VLGDRVADVRGAGRGVDPAADLADQRAVGAPHDEERSDVAGRRALGGDPHQVERERRRVPGRGLHAARRAPGQHLGGGHGIHRVQQEAQGGDGRRPGRRRWCRRDVDHRHLRRVRAHPGTS